MAIFLGNKAGLKIATVDLSDHVSSITLTRSFDSLDVSTLGDTAHKYVAGLRNDTVTVSFYNDTATGSVLQTLQAAFATTVAISMIQEKGTAVSATNNTYAGTILVNDLTDLNATPSEMSTIDITFQANSAITPSSVTAF